MAEVTIHLNDSIIRSLEGPLKARDVGWPEPFLFGPMEHMDMRVAGAELISQIAGPIR